MMKLSPQRSRLLVTVFLTFLILSAFVISGFTVATSNETITREIPLNQGSACSAVANNIIRNCGFEERNPADTGIALHWERFSNGQAWFGWYDETWEEAVRTGEHAQLMEIFQVEANVLDRVIAIYQTVNVAPNTNYSLTINAIMRSQVQPGDRNKDEFEMHWGVDFSGQGNYENVETWNRMILEEQFRLGSTGEFPDDVPLFYQTITGTIQTGASNSITLFIRGLKKFSTGAEVNFDVDDVSLVGIAAAPPPLVPTTGEANPAIAIQPSSNLPASGAILPKNVSAGALIISGLVLIALGAGAVAGLFTRREGP
ncbi:MAG TPA: hypothetical protein VEC96_13070 [Anaerolineae bacterium]|nr:hypothetical protein [Anaerolineae bacterium]